MITVTTDFKFDYNNTLTHGENFTKWRMLNSEERSANNEESLSPELAEKIFKSMHGEGSLSVDKPLVQ